MELLFELLLFVAKAAIIVVSLIIVIGFIFIIAQKSQQSQKGQLQVEVINDKYKSLRSAIRARLLGKKEFKLQRKLEKKAKKQKSEPDQQSRLFLIDFVGNVRASQVENLREEITAILTVAQAGDRVLCRIESQGGMVHTYGLAASQLQRLKDKNLRLIASIDKVAASGGYMMASVAHEIIAAPFAIVGSIGVVAQVPNLHRVLQKNDVDYHEYTAGEYKRTVSLLGKITPEGEDKFLEQLHDTHQLFKDHVAAHRPQLDLPGVATGEYWYGLRAKELGLVDQIMTSDEYLLNATDSHRVFKVCYTHKNGLGEKLTRAVKLSVDAAWERIGEELQGRRWGL